MTKEKRFTTTTACGHCSNRVPHEIVAVYSRVETHENEPGGYPHDSGAVFELIVCPACQEVSLQTYFWHEYAEPEDIKMEILYPVANKTPLGMPPKLESAYQAAVRVKSIDPNAFGVLVGRLLELVCIDRSAKGKTLNEGLSDLAARGEIPAKLVAVANGLRNLRNVGAHPMLGELTAAEVPVLDGLCRAILEYVYSAPSLAEQAEERLTHLKRPKGGK